MNLQSVDDLKALEYAVDCYRSVFKEIFKLSPDVTDRDRDSLNNLLKRTKLKKDQITRLVRGYFELDDEWLRENGFPMVLIEKKYNAIVTKNRRMIEGVKTRYVVGITESGQPVTSLDPTILEGTEFFVTPKPF